MTTSNATNRDTRCEVDSPSFCGVHEQRPFHLGRVEAQVYHPASEPLTRVDRHDCAATTKRVETTLTGPVPHLMTDRLKSVKQVRRSNATYSRMTNDSYTQCAGFSGAQICASHPCHDQLSFSTMWYCNRLYNSCPSQRSHIPHTHFPAILCSSCLINTKSYIPLTITNK
jgi:hypothetical protein